MKENTQTIISLDCATKSSGLAIFQDKELKAYKCLKESSTDLIKRIRNMTEKIEKIIKKYDNVIIILEDVRPENSRSLNMKTHKALMWLQASIAFMAYDNNIEIIYLLPSEWRSLCGIKTGSGIKRESLKKADIQFVQNHFDINENDDICDAIGIGYAYLARENKKEKEEKLDIIDGFEFK